jgi:ribonucleotide reductase alpha subunit
MSFLSNFSMQVVKRDGRTEDVSFDKVLERVRKAAEGLTVNPTAIAQKILAQIYNGVKTTELDELTCQLCASLATVHPDYGTLAARVCISNHQKNTDPSFSKVIRELSQQVAPKTGETVSYINEELLKVVEEHGEQIDAYIDHSRDYLLDYFGFKTLERAYLLKNAAGKTLERPQHLWMRVSLALWGSINLKRAFETYDLMSQKYFTHATPTLFNAGGPRQQLSSCFVKGTQVHTINGGVKNIEDVVIGDEVITHTGNIKKVVQCHCNPLNNRTIYDLKLAGTPTVSVTGNHRLWSLSDEQDKWGAKPGWNSVEYLRVGDWVAIPNKKGGENYVLDIKPILDTYSTDGNNVKYRYEYDDNGKVTPYATWKKHFANERTVSSEKKGDTFNRYWVFDETMMELLGIWFGDGCIVHGKNSAKQKSIRSINIVSYHNNTTLIDFVTKTFYEKFSIRHVSVQQDKNGMVSMSINNQYIAYIFKQLFNCGFDKKMIPTFFNKLPYSCITSFLSGLVSSDGCVGDNGCVAVQLTNPPLVNAIFHLARSVGISVTMTLMGTSSKKTAGRMSIPSNILNGKIKKIYHDDRIQKYENKKLTNWRNLRVIDGTTFMRINVKTPTNKSPEYVYTLGVEDDHSYSVGGFIAENCFLQAMHSDSIEGIFKTLTDCALISKWAGGIGLHVHNIRAKGALIKGTNGRGDGLVPMLRTFNATARYINQGGRRNGSFAIYLEPWHADVEDFLRLKLNTGSEEERARDLFYALWVSDLFMKRVEADEDWTLFCPNEAPGLSDVHGQAFEELYTRYEMEGRGKKVIKAQKLWFQILDTQMETGTPYLLYKDAANAKSNQKNLGTIKSSNLCVAPETYILTDKGQQMISELVDQEVNVWNGEKWSKTTVRKTGESQKLVTVYLSNGAQLTCTPYHKFIIHSDNTTIANSERIEAKDLVEGMTLCKWSNLEGILQEHKIVSVTDNDRIDDTYCFNEPENHAGVFNGILTGNCSEIIEYSDETECAVCNLASIGLPSLVDTTTKSFNFDKLREIARVATANLNRVIDINYYPTPETKKSNMRHRPIGIGVQGLADVFAMMRLPWDSDEAADLNQRIFEHMYFAAVEESMRIALYEEEPYKTFNGSPASQGLLQPDLWKITPLTETDGSLDWKTLRENVQRYGIRNSLLIAPMPTASTSQILGYNEAFEPFTSNLYTRRTLAGEYIVINKHLLKDLIERDLWNDDLKQKIIARNGSVQDIEEIPEDIQNLYKTAWELKQRTLIDMAAARGAFICQSQSLNLFVADPSYAKLTSMHFYGWKKGLKTGCYYLRTKAAVMAQKFTVDPKFLTQVETKQQEEPPTEKKVETKVEKLERLAREYEESVKEAKEAAEKGEGCLMCSG